VGKRISEAKKYPHVVKLPKGCTSPTNSVYQRYDIVKQGRVLQTYEPDRNKLATVRSAEPFILRVKMPSGKIKEIASKLS